MASGLPGEAGAAIDYSNQQPQILPVIADLGSAYQFISAPTSGNLAVGASQRYTFRVRNSEVISTDTDQVLIGVEVQAKAGSSLQPGLPVIRGLTPLATEIKSDRLRKCSQRITPITDLYPSLVTSSSFPDTIVVIQTLEKLLNQSIDATENSDRLWGLVTALKGMQARQQGNKAQSVAFMEKALQLLPSDHSWLRSLILLNLGVTYFVADNYEGAKRLLIYIYSRNAK